MSKPLFRLEVSPLMETNYTGISNVVYELTKYALNSNEFNSEFVHGSYLLPNNLVRSLIKERSGVRLQKYLSSAKAEKLEHTVDGVLYTNVRPVEKLHSYEAQIIYDLSPFLVPECHHRDTVIHHTHGFSEQLSSNDRIFCISESVRSDLTTYFDVASDRISVCLLGHNLDESSILNVEKTFKKYLNKGFEVEPFILLLSTFEPRKNFELLFEWLRVNPAVLDSYRVVVAGRDGWGQSFDELIHDKGLGSFVSNSRIKRLGYVSENQKAALLSKCSAFVFPSFFEGFGLPVLEAMHVGAPVIASSSTSIPEVLGECGYYFNPESIQSFDSAFTRFHDDFSKNRCSEFVQQAKLRASGFTYNSFCSTIFSQMSNGVFK